MYITTGEGLAQASMLSGLIAGILGEPSDVLLDFRTKVHTRPQDFKRLLLVVYLHPFPRSSWFINQYSVAPKQHLLDTALIASEVGVNDAHEQVVDELGPISQRFEKTNADFRQQIAAEKQLHHQTTKTIQELIRQKVILKQHKPLLLEAALLDPKLLQRNPEGLALKFFDLGSLFAAGAPGAVGPNLINSDASDAHLTHFGWALTRYAHALQKKDRTFRKEVEQERQKRQQAENRKRRQQRKKRK